MFFMDNHRNYKIIPPTCHTQFPLLSPRDFNGNVTKQFPTGFAAPLVGVAILNKEVFVSASATLTAGAAGRYATALFEIAKDAGNIAAVEADLDQLQNALNDSADLQSVMASPIISRDDQGAVLAAITKKLGLGSIVSNTVALMAANRRLPELGDMVSQVKALAADERGEITAEVQSAKKLTETQSKALAAALKKSIGKTVKVNVTVDESLIGGLIVKVGSVMVDSSLRSKLNNLQNAMKEVG